MKFRPIYGIAGFAAFMGLVLVLNWVVEGGHERSTYTRVSPGPGGAVRISVADLEPDQVRFYHFLNPSNQEVRFFLGRDGEGHLQAAFDANQICYKKARGYRAEGEWVVCNFCDKSFRVAEVNAGGGGCKPVPLTFTERGEEVVLLESDLLQGWRYFRG